MNRCEYCIALLNIDNKLLEETIMIREENERALFYQLQTHAIISKRIFIKDHSSKEVILFKLNYIRVTFPALAIMQDKIQVSISTDINRHFENKFYFSRIISLRRIITYCITRINPR